MTSLARMDNSHGLPTLFTFHFALQPTGRSFGFGTYSSEVDINKPSTESKFAISSSVYGYLFYDGLRPDILVLHVRTGPSLSTSIYTQHRFAVQFKVFEAVSVQPLGVTNVKVSYGSVRGLMIHGSIKPTLNKFSIHYNNSLYVSQLQACNMYLIIIP